jgi:hypothetical protein
LGSSSTIKTRIQGSPERFMFAPSTRVATRSCLSGTTGK